jgi:subtilase family serine protease
LRLEELEPRVLLSTWPPFSPAQVRQAYGFDRVTFANPHGGAVQGDGSGQTIAIVDAFDDPRIWRDLQTFDAKYGLPDPPSFIRATPLGKPPRNGLWSFEIALDVEWAHAIAPGANILLVEAPSNSAAGLFGALDFARKQPGVVAVSCSWSGPEFSGERIADRHFATPVGHIGGSGLPGGITFVVASGDDGAPPEWPAISPRALAVGGTSLTIDDAGNYGGEVGWSGSGGGKSRIERRPAYQDAVQDTGRRQNPDVAYNADPDTGVAVYDSVPSAFGAPGWWQMGGTSAAAPQWAALIAIADQGRALAGLGSLDGLTQTLPALYSLPGSDFHDITTGSNGFDAGPGYDLVTGLGSPYADRLVPDLVKVGLISPGSKVSVASAASGVSAPGAGLRAALSGAGSFRAHLDLLARPLGLLAPANPGPAPATKQGQDSQLPWWDQAGEAFLTELRRREEFGNFQLTQSWAEGLLGFHHRE